MVEFKGDITPKNTRMQIRRTSKLVGWSGLAVCFSVALLYLILFLFGVCDFEDIKYVGGPFAFAFLMAIIVLIFPVPKINDIRGRAVSIEIDETRVRCERPHHALPFVEVSIHEVKRVLDYGECYYIIYTDIAQAIVCQKDLLRQGTIEEFESLFEGKIKRRCKKKK